uniref:NB-ARC domain-containing protein n=1 Tax=Fagus sylvatica TaxID=28930 RepID=A0A2N9IYM7_FAGSY
MIGIIGVHGIGKSTIAKAAFNSYANCFDGSSFVDNIGEKFNRNHDLHKIQQNLLSEILGDTSLKVYNEDRGVNIIKERLSSRKVFLVLDNVDDLKQLEKLAGGHDWFGSGSRILITTRKKKLLNLHGVQSIYELKRMSQREALKLFSWHALQRDKPVGGNMELVNAALRYTKGIPLFLVKLATDLFSKSMSYWGSELYEEIGQDGKNIEEGENRIRVWNKLNEQFKIRYNVETKTLDPSLAQLFRQALEVKSDVQLDTTILDESADVDWDHDVGFDLDYDDEKIKDAMTCHHGNASDGDGLFMEDQQSQHEDNATQLSQDGDDKFEDANTDFDRNILDDDGDAYSIPTQPSQDGEDNFEDVSTNYDGNMLDGDGDGEDELGDVRTNYSGNALDGNGDGEDKFGDVSTYYGGNALDGEDKFGDVSTYYDENALNVNGDGEDKFGDVSTYYGGNALDGEDKFGDVSTYYGGNALDGEDKFGDVSTYYGGNALNGDGDGEYELGDVRTYYDGNALDGDGDGEDKFGDVSTYYGGNALNGDGDGENELGDVRTYYDGNALYGDEDGEDKFGDVSTYYGGNAIDGYGDGEDNLGDVRTYYRGNALDGDGDGEDKFGNVSTYYAGNASDGDDKFGDVATDSFGDALYGEGDNSLIEPSQDDDGPIDETMYLENTTSLSNDFD